MFGLECCPCNKELVANLRAELKRLREKPELTDADKQVRSLRQWANVQDPVFCADARSWVRDLLDSHDTLIEKLKRIERETKVVQETGRKLK